MLILGKLKIVLRPITVPIRRWIKFDRLRDIWSYIKGVNSAYKPFPGGMLEVSNSSGGFLERIIELAEKYSDSGKWLLVSEPPTAGKQIKDEWLKKHSRHLPDIISIEEVLGTSWNSQKFDYDLCIYPIVANPQKFSVVMHQSLLEHVIDPVTVIRNLNDFLITGVGIQVIQTVNIYCSLHRFPIDSLRYFPDFFENLEKYVDVKCLSTFMENGSIYAVLQNNQRPI